jgi:hypothetical protein
MKNLKCDEYYSIFREWIRMEFSMWVHQYVLLQAALAILLWCMGIYKIAEVCTTLNLNPQEVTSSSASQLPEPA